MRVIKARRLDNIVIDLPDNLESLKFIINNRFYFSSFWYEYISKNKNK
jgi:thymidylate kinase